MRREFNPPVPTTHLVSDITYLKTGEGWLFLATVIDLTTRMVVGWATAKHMRTSLIIDALKVAYQGGYVAEGAIAHSDRGSRVHLCGVCGSRTIDAGSLVSGQDWGVLGQRGRGGVFRFVEE